MKRVYGLWIWRNNSQICKASSKKNGTGKYIVWLTQKARKGYFRYVKLKKFSQESMPPDPLGACAFGACFAVNRSSFFLDPRLSVVAMEPNWTQPLSAPHLASHADVLRLVTRSSPRGEERVTSLRTSAWEARSKRTGQKTDNSSRAS